jgi:hypothetical protein
MSAVASLLLGASVGLAQPAAGNDACLRVLSPVAEDAVPAPSQFAPAICGRSIVARAFRYDRSEHATRAARALAFGDIVRRYPEYGVAAIVPGEALTLVAVSGVARVERRVEALQEARTGQRVFVKSRDGQVLSVRYEASVP